MPPQGFDRLPANAYNIDDLDIDNNLYFDGVHFYERQNGRYYTLAEHQKGNNDPDNEHQGYYVWATNEEGQPVRFWRSDASEYALMR